MVLQGNAAYARRKPEFDGDPRLAGRITSETVNGTRRRNQKEKDRTCHGWRKRRTRLFAQLSLGKESKNKSTLKTKMPRETTTRRHAKHSGFNGGNESARPLRSSGHTVYTVGPTRIGEVHEAAATMDWRSREERSAEHHHFRRHHWHSGSRSGEKEPHQIIDRPSHVDFTVEVENVR